MLEVSEHTDRGSDVVIHHRKGVGQKHGPNDILEVGRVQPEVQNRGRCIADRSQERTAVSVSAGTLDHVGARREYEHQGKEVARFDLFERAENPEHGF